MGIKTMDSGVQMEFCAIHFFGFVLKPVQKCTSEPLSPVPFAGYQVIDI